jgi:hypothetical protein
MGDRILFQAIGTKSSEFGPVIYGHWSGESGPQVCERFAKRMIGRMNDVPYATARLMQELIGDADGNTGFGCWNADAILTEKDSHGDAGVVLVDVSGPQVKFQCLGGYLVASKDGSRVTSKYDEEAA